MLKSILAIIVGYVVMAITAFALLYGAALGLGIERIFESKSYVAATLWLANMVVATLIAGILGGWLCAVMSKSKGACLIFAGMVFALGLLFAIPLAMRAYPPTVRPGDVTIIQAMVLARTPAWILLLNPLVGAVGVLRGARIKERR